MNSSREKKGFFSNKSPMIMFIYIIFLMLPVYWLVNMSFKTNEEILGTFSLFPVNFTFDNYIVIFTDPSWYWGYLNSMTYVTMNTVISLLPTLD